MKRTTLSFFGILCLLFFSTQTYAQGINQITNGGFETDLNTDWTHVAADGGDAVYSLETSGSWEGTNHLKNVVSTLGSNNWSIQSVHGVSFAVEQTHTYRLSLKAKGDGSGNVIKAVVQDGSFQNLADFTLTDTWETYTVNFTPNEASKTLKIWYRNTGTYYLDSIAIVDLDYVESIDNDPVTIATFEPTDNVNFAALNTWPGGTDTVANPAVDAINGSATCLKFEKLLEHNSLIDLYDFKMPLSIYTNPEFKIKVMSPDTTNVTVTVSFSDINGASVSKSAQLTASIGEWQELTFDFEEFLSSTAISYLISSRVSINSGNTTGFNQIFYIDDLVMTGENAELTESDVVTLFQEAFHSNGWFLSDQGGGYYVSADSTLSGLRTTAWGGSALSANAAHYNGDDSLVVAMTNWSGRAVGQLNPAATRPGLGSLIIKDINISGKANMGLSYELRWHTAPAAFTDAPTIEYSLDGAAWVEVTTSSDLPTGTGSWSAPIEYDLSTVNGADLKLRITNNTTGVCHFDEVTLTGTNTFASSITIAGDSEITVQGDSVQLSITTLPALADQSAYWYISKNRFSASVDGTGKVIAIKDGEIEVTAIAIDKTGLAQTTHTINITNQHPVDSVMITSVDDVDVIDVPFGTLQLTGMVYPGFASNPEMLWSTDSDTVATIDENGLLTAVYNGVVDVILTSIENAAKADTLTVTVSNQYKLVEDINLSVEGSTTIPEYMETVQVMAEILPADADTTTLMWSSQYDTVATVDQNGLVTIVDTGMVYIYAMATDISGVEDSILLTFLDEVAFAESVEITTEGGATSIDVDNGTLQMIATVLPTYTTDPSVTWSLIPEGYATIDESGLLTAYRNGVIEVIAVANGGTDVSDTIEITLSNQIVSVTDIEIITEGGALTIETDNGTLQCDAIVTPDFATNLAVVWSAVSFTQASATIDQDGLLTGVVDGQVSVIATAVDGSGVADTIQVNISNQIVLVSDIVVSSENDQTSINIEGGTLQFSAVAMPDYATNQSVVWSVSPAEYATIDETGLLTAVFDGVVDVIATAADTSGVADTMQITINNQATPLAITLDQEVVVEHITSPEDYSISAELSWFADSIFLVIDVTDDVLITTTETGGDPWTVDNLEVYFDLDNSKNALYPREIGWPESSYDDNDVQIRLMPGDASPNPDYNYKYTVTETGYMFEVAIPLKSIMADFETAIGNVIGFDILASDNDNDPDFRDQISWNTPNEMIWNDASYFGTLEMVDGFGFAPIYDDEGPTEPMDFAIETEGYTATLSWNPATDNIAVQKYLVFQDDQVIDTLVASDTAAEYQIADLSDGDYTFGVQAFDIYDNASDEVTEDVTVVGIGQSTYCNIKVYPVPVNDELHIDNIENIVRIDILDVKGQMIHTIENNAANATINVSELSDGIYHLRMQYSNGVITRKFIK